MAATIQKAFPEAALTLIPGRGGVFTVMVDGVEMWNKGRTGRFPEGEEVVAKMAI